MNREEAAREIDNTACCFSDKRFRDAMHMAAAALRGPQPDPDTGLMPCGCGGKAEVGDGNKAFCGRCGITTLEQFTQEDAKSEWNRAMGWRVEG